MISVKSDHFLETTQGSDSCPWIINFLEPSEVPKPDTSCTRQDGNTCYAHAISNVLWKDHCTERYATKEEMINDLVKKNSKDGALPSVVFQNEISQIANSSMKQHMSMKTAEAHLTDEKKGGLVGTFGLKISQWKAFSAWFDANNPNRFKVFCPPNAPDDERSAQHAVAVFSHGSDFWRFKNSYGDDWGDSGFGKINKSVPFDFFGMEIKAAQTEQQRAEQLARIMKRFKEEFAIQCGVNPNDQKALLDLCENTANENVWNTVGNNMGLGPLQKMQITNALKNIGKANQVSDEEKAEAKIEQEIKDLKMDIQTELDKAGYDSYEDLEEEWSEAKGKASKLKGGRRKRAQRKVDALSKTKTTILDKKNEMAKLQERLDNMAFGVAKETLLGDKYQNWVNKVWLSKEFLGKRNRSPPYLFWASHAGELDVVKYLVSGKAQTQNDMKGLSCTVQEIHSDETAFSLACRGARPKVVEYLLEQKADPSKFIHYKAKKKTPIYAVCRDAQLAKLSDDGQSVKPDKEDERRALTIDALAKNKWCRKKINQLAKGGNFTALRWACQNNLYQTVRMLLKHKANPAEHQHQNSVLAWALQAVQDKKTTRTEFNLPLVQALLGKPSSKRLFDATLTPKLSGKSYAEAIQKGYKKLLPAAIYVACQDQQNLPNNFEVIKLLLSALQDLLTPEGWEAKQTEAKGEGFYSVTGLSDSEVESAGCDSDEGGDDSKLHPAYQKILLQYRIIQNTEHEEKSDDEEESKQEKPAILELKMDKAIKDFNANLVEAKMKKAPGNDDLEEKKRRLKEIKKDLAVLGLSTLSSFENYGATNMGGDDDKFETGTYENIITIAEDEKS
jgi:ankyrin repeat protein